MTGDRDDDVDDRVPLFPGLCVNNDTRPPSTNKMALFDVDSQSRSSPSLPPRNEPPIVTIGKRKLLRPHSTEWYNSFSSTTKRGDESFLQSGRPFNYRNLQNSETVGHNKNSSSSSSPRRTEIDLIHHDRASTAGIAVKKEDFSGLNLTTDEVVRVIGPKLFVEARKMMIHQQKMFSWQMFELHRLITVQRLIARSPETLHEYNFRPIKFPPINKLLYVSPLDTSSSKTHDALKSDRGSTTSLEKGHLAQPLPNSAPNWCFPPPPGGNQWLIPVKSPSEGLVYKPYPGAFMTPVYGNCGPISSLHGNEHGSYNAESYFQPYPMPLMHGSYSISEFDKSERQERDALSLFPTTPSVDASKEQRNEHKVQVIKVVPHKPDSTPASAARILQSIQEGRRKYKTPSSPS